MKRVQVHTKETIGQAAAAIRPTVQQQQPNTPVRGGMVSSSAVMTPVTPSVEQTGIINMLNGHLGLPAQSDIEPNVAVVPSRHAQPHRHMHIKPSVKANQLNAQIDRFAERYCEATGTSLSDFAHPAQTSQEDVLVFGRIVADNDEKMTDQSVLLEASRAGGSGVRIPLDLSLCPSYSIFPGQIVILEGKNPDGSKFIVSSQKSIPAPKHDPVRLTKDCSMMVAAGPYSMDSGSLDFSPLDRLLLLALERKPSLLILMGPFMDADNQAVKLGTLADLPDSVFKNQFLAKLQIFSQRSPATRVVIVPSPQDLGHDYTFPQCSFQPAVVGDQILSAPNPACLSIEDSLLVGVSSVDVLLRLGLSELQRAPQLSDRFARLSQYLYQQSTYYPIQPAHDGVNLDYNHMEGLEMSPRPSILICPSALRFFARPIPGEDVLVVNPGQFCRKQGLGSAAIVSVLANASAEFTTRCRVDIIQF